MDPRPASSGLPRRCARRGFSSLHPTYYTNYIRLLGMHVTVHGGLFTSPPIYGDYARWTRLRIHGTRMVRQIARAYTGLDRPDGLIKLSPSLPPRSALLPPPWLRRCCPGPGPRALLQGARAGTRRRRREECGARPCGWTFMARGGRRPGRRGLYAAAGFSYCRDRKLARWGRRPGIGGGVALA
jgi:hypothetical protein